MSAKALLSASVSAPPVYVEDVFSTYLYTGNGSTQTITNGIDLSGKGGLVWIKSRTWDYSHYLTDTVKGPNSQLRTDVTSGQDVDTQRVTSFLTTGFTLGTEVGVNNSAYNYASWTFRKEPKFFDVVTWSGNDASNRQIPHNLGSVPGCIIARAYNNANDWSVYHRSLGNTKALYLNLTQAQETNTNWGNTTPTSSVFTTNLNGAGNTYIAYLFAHDAGGFGTAGTDNVVSCGYAAGGTTVNLGWEPQWVLTKNPASASNWLLVDNMRGMPADGGGSARGLLPNSSDAESDWGGYVKPTSTGFYNGINAIYIAIRRGPMKVPTVGTSVFSPNAASSGTQTTNFSVDMQILSYRTGTDSFLNHQVVDRLRGVSSTSTPQGNYLNTSSTAAESNATPYSSINMSNIGFDVPSNYAGASGVFHSFRRAPGFFDVVCYTGTGTSSRNNSHNLAVVPELMIVKERNFGGTNWRVYSSALGNTKEVYLNQTNASTTTTSWASTTPTASVFTVGVSGGAGPNDSGSTYVAYLFATVAGVSKVGSYTGNGTTQTINCGFTGGARFVLIKRTDSTGDWYVWDTARGIISGNDPFLLLNSTNAEDTSTDYIDPLSSGFEISSTAPAAINANGGTYIFLAIS